MYTPIKLSDAFAGNAVILRQAVSPAQDKAVILAEHSCPSDLTLEWVVWTCYPVPSTEHTLEPTWTPCNGTYIRLGSGFGRALDVFTYRAEVHEVADQAVIVNTTTLASRMLRGQY